MLKKICFVAHEFGFFSGHGGIAAYLHNICKYILQSHKYLEVYILVNCYDKQSELLNYEKLHIIEISDSKDVYRYLTSINPDFVEVADYGAFALDCLLAKNLNGEFSNTIFAVHHHTASRECYEWNTLLPIKYANDFTKNWFMKEKLQIMLADAQISPSNFMSDYVRKNYFIHDEIRAFNHINVEHIKNKEILVNELSKIYDFEQFKGTFNIIIISRVEGRKNQRFLIDQFIKFRKKVSKSKLFIVGNSNYDEITNEEYRFQIFKEIPIEYRNDILFFDFANAKQKDKFIAIGDLCVLPSTFESFSIALGETILKGVPGMASKYTGCCDYLGDTKDITTFDPFDNNDLADKIEKFYNLSKEDKMKILLTQQETFSKVTSPVISVDSRLEWINKKLESKREYNRIDSWQYVNNQENIIFSKKHLILTPNSKKNSIINKFLKNFILNNNFIDKIIIFNHSYAYINEVIDAVFYGCPIMILNADSIFTKGKSISYRNILDYVNSRKEQVIEIAITDLGELEHNKTHLNFMLSLNEKLNLQGKVNG